MTKPAHLTNEELTDIESRWDRACDVALDYRQAGQRILSASFADIPRLIAALRASWDEVDEDLRRPARPTRMTTDEELAASVITTELANGALKDWSMSRCAEVATDIIDALDAADVGIEALRASRAEIERLRETLNALRHNQQRRDDGLLP